MNISNGTGFNWNRFLTIYAFYSIVGFSGLIIIPTLAIISPVFIVCAVIAPLLGIIKLIDYLLDLGIPYAQYIGFEFGATIINPVGVFILSIITGVVLYLVGYGSWKLLLFYIKKVSKIKRELSI